MKIVIKRRNEKEAEPVLILVLTVLSILLL